jgi:nucleoid DNA-binding protein
MTEAANGGDEAANHGFGKFKVVGRGARNGRRMPRAASGALLLGRVFAD